MKNNKWGRKALSATLAATMVLSTAATVWAQQTTPPIGEQARAKAQPEFFGYRVNDITNWSVETDPNSEFLTAKIPLQNRIAPFQATQANPELASDAQVMLMQGDYSGSPFDSMLYNNDFSDYVLNYWQYVDYFSPWHGAPIAATPKSMYEKSLPFEYGIVNIPNPAYTNAAHKNGVMSIACVYFDTSFRVGQTCEDLFRLKEAGVYTTAQKLVDMAKEYGFDGYFLNCEESGFPNEYKEFMSYLSANGLYTQWYDVGHAFDAGKAEWLSDDKYDVINNSVYVNYGWPSYADENIEFAIENGYDPFKQTFFGVECNLAKFSGGHKSSKDLPLLYEAGTKNPRGVSLFTPCDYYRCALGDDVKVGGLNQPIMQVPEYQWMVAERERMFFSGVMEDPTNTGIQADYSRRDVGVKDASGWVGVADFISERSVIGGSVFYTNFNTGHGMQFFMNGAVSSDEQWANINIQDYLPSWQWWIDSEGGKLEADFDYGDKEIRNDAAGAAMTLPYTQVGAYQGGSSLVLYGDVDAKNTMHLYKTELAVNAASSAELTFKKTSEGDAALKLGVITKEDPSHIVEFDVPSTIAAGEWTTSTISLASLAGKTIAAICLVVDGEETGYQMNVGGLRILDGENHTPAAPENLRIDRAYDTKEMILKWDLADYDEVKQYNVYANKAGKEIYLGGVYDDIFYIKDLDAAILQADTDAIDSVTVLPGALTVTKGESADFSAIVAGERLKAGLVSLTVKAVGADGSESAPAVENYNYNEKVSNITVDECETESTLMVHAATPGELHVSWDAPLTGDFDSYILTAKLLNVSGEKEETQVFTTTAAKDATRAVIDVPVAEGYNYDLYVSTVKDGVESAPLCYRGMTNDSYAEPFALADLHIQRNNARFFTPSALDWRYITVYADGVEKTTFERGVGSGGKLTYRVPTGTKVLSVTMTDYAGNVSEMLDANIVSVSIMPSFLALNTGTSQQLTASVTGAADKSVTWKLKGAFSANTNISESGLLTVGADETSSVLTITATSNESPACSAALMALIAGPAAAALSEDDAEAFDDEITEEIVSISDPIVEAKADAVRADELTVSQEVTWTVEGATSDRTTIDENGKLYVAYNEKAKELTVRATSAADPTKSGTAVVKVIEDTYAPDTQYYVEVNTDGNGSVTPGSGMYDIGSKQTFEITPDEGCLIDKVLVDGKEYAVSGSKITLYIDQPYTVAVTFKKGSAPGIDVEEGGSTATENPQTGDHWYSNLF